MYEIQSGGKTYGRRFYRNCRLHLSVNTLRKVRNLALDINCGMNRDRLLEVCYGPASST